MRAERRQIENEALRLFEFDTDEEFRTRGKVVLDSSLGLMPQPRQTRGARRNGSGKKH